MEDKHFFKKLLEAFRTESKNRTEAISDNLLKLENENNKNDYLAIMEDIYREVHSLKSAARAANILDIEKICQKIEDILFFWKQNKYTPERAKLNIFHKINDAIEGMIDGNENKSDLRNKKVEELILLADKLKLETFIENDTQIITHHPENLSSQNNVKIDTKKLDAILTQAEELIASKLSFIQRAEELTDLKRLMLDSHLKFQNALHEIKILHSNQSSNLLDEENPEKKLKKTFEYFEWGDKSLKLVNQKIDALLYKHEQDFHVFSLSLDSLLDDAKKLMLMPFSTLLGLFPKIARNLASDLHKEINLIIEGGEIEIDKRILEEIKDVLLHLLRNSIDHGIEDPEVRKKLNKPEKGTIKVIVRQLSGNEISIEFLDDGAGINLNAVKKAAIKLGTVSEENSSKMSPEDAINLIYHSGISTSPIITDLSGRGLGMAIIREKIEKVGGKISLKTQENKGTLINIELPLTMATFNGLLIKSSGNPFIIPTANLERIIRIPKSKIKTVENKEVIPYEQKTISLVFLSDILTLERKPLEAENSEHLLAIIIAFSEKKVAFIVDEVLNEYEILVKNFVKPIIKLKNISSAAILGSGKAVPILNCLDMLSNIQLAHIAEPLHHKEKKTTNKQILLVEDSITTRMLLKNILELGGYLVTTAVDGLDAWEKLSQIDFSIVVSDVDMPKMNGFKLTEMIRKDKNLNKLPIVLVTARETREDREQGIEVGANAYLPKSTFDSGQLLEVITRLKI